MKCRQCLRMLRMHLGQLRKCLHCLFRKIQIRIPPLRLRTIDAQQNAPTAARVDNAAPSERHIFACVLLRMIGVTQIIIGLREIAPDPLRLLCRLEFRQQNAQIALSLFMGEQSRVTSMHERQQGRSNGIGFWHSPIGIAQLFMNTANIVTSRAASEDTRRIGVKQHFPGHFIDIVPRDEKDFFPLNIRCFNRPPQMSPCICGEIFICINEYDPIPRGMGKRRITRRSKVVCPWNFIHRSSAGLCSGHGIVM